MVSCMRENAACKRERERERERSVDILCPASSLMLQPLSNERTSEREREREREITML